MAKRRVHGLRDAAESMSRVATAEADNAEDQLSRGRCDSAIRALQRAAFALGRGEAHAGLENKTYAAKRRVADVVERIAKSCRLR
jgi:hypothetical protein